MVIFCHKNIYPVNIYSAPCILGIYNIKEKNSYSYFFIAKSKIINGIKRLRENVQPHNSLILLNIYLKRQYDIIQFP